MNTETPPPLPTNPLALHPMDGPITLLAVIEQLLKKPGCILHEYRSGNVQVPLRLLFSALFSLGVFGLLLGAFSGGIQLWAAPLKITAGMMVAVMICLPSLYIFSALGGVDALISQIAGLLLAMVSLTGLLLLGFAPVIWVFSASTESVGFMGILAVTFWAIALFFGARLLLNAARSFGLKSSGYLKLWLGIFVIVALQMSTSIRPIIGKADTLLPTQKRFFISHWMESFTSEGQEATKE